MNNAQTHLKMGYVWTICLVAACGGLLFGYDWVVIGGAKPFYEAWFSITDPAQSGWAMSSALLGCIFGALISGCVRRQAGAQAATNSFRCAVQRVGLGTAVASHFDMFVIYRIVGGVGIGLASALSPLYIAESVRQRKEDVLSRSISAHHRDWRAGRSVNQSDDC